MMKIEIGRGPYKRSLTITDDNTLETATTKGKIKSSYNIKDIYGIVYKPAGLMMDGVLAVALTYDEAQETLSTRIMDLEGCLVQAVTKTDHSAVAELIEWFEKNKTEKADDSPYDLDAKSHGSFLALQGNTIIIRHTGMANTLAKGGMQGEKRIPIKSVLSVQFKDAGTMTSGYIQFETAGGSQHAARGGLTEAAADENSVLFNEEDQPAFEQIRDRINEIINTTEAPVGGVSDADELAKFAKLRDDGIITEDEFQTRKKKILGL